MFFLKYYGFLVILSIHILFGIFAYFFANFEDSNPNADVREKVTIIGSNKHSALVYYSLPRYKVSYLIESNIPELINKVNKSTDDAHAVIIFVGIKDQPDDTDLQLLINKLPAAIPLFWVSVPPVDSRLTDNFSNQNIAEFNQKIKMLCSSKPNCSFINIDKLMSDETGNLKANLHRQDGVQLNNAGVKMVSNVLDSTIP